MRFIADLHIHSRFSRATSRDLDLTQLCRWARLKGISVVGTGDVTHPGWLDEIRRDLTPDDETGLFRLREEPSADIFPKGFDTASPVRFMLTGEISSIYSYGGKTRKVHNVVCLPDLDAAERFAAKLERIGNIRSDGRPILGLDSRNLLEILLEVSSAAVLIPAHIWTPWFSVLGSKSGFDTIEECYRDLSGHIFALETGLSSDPPMNRMVSSLDRYTLISNSDAHSAANLGREATVFSSDMTHAAIMEALRTGKGYEGTLEFFPEEGKYHLDGHRKCDIRLEPSDSLRHKGICPGCGGKLTLGVLFRVSELADRTREQVPQSLLKFRSVLSLDGILGEILGVGPSSKKVAQHYTDLLGSCGPELGILLETDPAEIDRVHSPILGEAIRRVRSGRIHAQGGYDGEYGTIRVFEPGEVQRLSGQTALFSDKPRTIRKRTCAVPLEVRETPAAADLGTDSLLPNEAQAVAIEHDSGPLLVVAGPGTGKTRTLVERIVRLITTREVAPSSILAVTFSNRAAGEMAERIDTVLMRSGVDGRPETTTFHRLGLAVIAENFERLGFTQAPAVLSDRDYRELWKKFNSSGATAHNDPEPALIAVLENFSDRLPSREELGCAAGAEFARFMEYKRNHCLVDYPDLLLLPLLLFSDDPARAEQYRRRWSWIFVDELQDINALQYRLIRLFAAPGGNLFGIGDPDQAIYGFRGSDVRFFSQCEKDFTAVQTVALTRGYRSTDTILQAGAAILGGGGARPRISSGIRGPEKIDHVCLPTERAEAEQVVKAIEALIGGSSHFAVYTGRSGPEEVSDVGFRDIAVLYRTHACGDPVEEALSRSGIPVQRPRKASVFDNGDISATMSFLRLCLHPRTGFFGEQMLRHGPQNLNPSDRARLSKNISRSYDGSIPVIPWTAMREEKISAQLTRLDQQVTAVAALDTQGDVVGAVHAGAEAMGIGDEQRTGSSWNRLYAIARQCTSLSHLCASVCLGGEEDEYDPRAEGVTLMTLHASKGLEWKAVFIVGCEDGLLPMKGWGGDTEVDEERRLLYVGMTRARKFLCLSHARSRVVHGTRQSRDPSPFLNDIPRRLVRELRPTVAKKSRRTVDGVQVGLFDRDF